MAVKGVWMSETHWIHITFQTKRIQPFQSQVSSLSTSDASGVGFRIFWGAKKHQIDFWGPWARAMSLLSRQDCMITVSILHWRISLDSGRSINTVRRRDHVGPSALEKSAQPREKDWQSPTRRFRAFGRSHARPDFPWLKIMCLRHFAPCRRLAAASGSRR